MLFELPLPGEYHIEAGSTFVVMLARLTDVLLTDKYPLKAEDDFQGIEETAPLLEEI